MIFKLVHTDKIVRIQASNMSEMYVDMVYCATTTCFYSRAVPQHRIECRGETEEASQFFKTGEYT